MGVMKNKLCNLINMQGGMNGVVYFQKKVCQTGERMHFQMCKPKYFSQDKLEDVIFGDGVGYMMYYREETLEIRGWICIIKVQNDTENS